MGSARVRFSNTDSTPQIFEVCTSSRDGAKCYKKVLRCTMVLFNSLQVEFEFFSYHPLYDKKTGLDEKKRKWSIK